MDTKLIRTILIVTVAIVMIGCAGPTQHVELSPLEIKLNTALVTAIQLNLRDSPSAKGEVLQVLQKGDFLEILSREGNWLEVAAPDGQKGWVHGRYVKTGQLGPDTSDQTEIIASPPKKAKPPKAAAAEPTVAAKATPAKVAKAPSPKPVPAKGPVLRPQLETVWENRRQAHRDGDLALIQKFSSDYSYGTQQNQLAAVGRELKPENVTALYDLMPDLATFTFVELKQNGPTVGMLYLDEGEKDDDPNLPPPVHFLLVKFVKEARGWTVDGILSKGEPKYQKDGSETRFNYAGLPAELAIDGKVRPAPPAAAKPTKEVVEGTIDISSFDYITQASINGIAQKTTEGGRSSETIKGGLKKGENSIEIVITKSAKALSDWPPEIVIRHLNAKGQEVEAFKFALDENVDGTHVFSFLVK